MRWPVGGAACIWGARTSGNVPLEKTLKVLSARMEKILDGRHVHQQASLSAGTIANNDEFATDFSHGGCWRTLSDRVGRRRETIKEETKLH